MAAAALFAFPDLRHSDAGTTAEERRDAILARNARVHALNNAVHPAKEGGLYRLIGGCGGEHASAGQLDDPAATSESGPVRPLPGWVREHPAADSSPQTRVCARRDV